MEEESRSYRDQVKAELEELHQQNRYLQRIREKLERVQKHPDFERLVLELDLLDAESEVEKAKKVVGYREKTEAELRAKLEELRGKA